MHRTHTHFYCSAADLRKGQHETIATPCNTRYISTVTPIQQHTPPAPYEEVTLDEAISIMEMWEEKEQELGRGSVTMSVGDALRIVKLARQERALPLYSPIISTPPTWLKSIRLGQ